MIDLERLRIHQVSLDHVPEQPDEHKGAHLTLRQQFQNCWLLHIHRFEHSFATQRDTEEGELEILEALAHKLLGGSDRIVASLNRELNIRPLVNQLGYLSESTLELSAGAVQDNHLILFQTLRLWIEFEILLRQRTVFH